MSVSDDRAKRKWDPAAEARVPPRSRSNLRRTAPATLLIAVGVILLLTTTLDWSPSGALWPLWLLFGGVASVILAVSVARAAGELLIVLGSIGISVGAILLVQSLTGYWRSWAYAWALVMPTAIGAGMWAWGHLERRSDMRSLGKGMVRFGLALFASLAVLLELILGLGGHALGRPGWAGILILVGVLCATQRLWSKRRPR